VGSRLLRALRFAVQTLRQCRARGIFSEKNTRLVRNLGITIIGAQAVVCRWDLVCASNQNFPRTKGRHGRSPTQIYQRDDVFAGSWHGRDWLPRARAREVFRQGLALKKENRTHGLTASRHAIRLNLDRIMLERKMI